MGRIPAHRLHVPYSEQVAGLTRAALALALLGVVVGFFGLAGLVVGILAGVTALTLLLIVGIVRLQSRRWRQDLERLAAGEHRLHWRFDQSAWAAFRAGRARRRSLALWLLPGGLAVSGLVVAFLAHSDGERFWGSAALTFAVPIAAGAALGGVISLAARWFAGTSERLMARYPGELLVGDRGFYLTGEYWPWSSFGQRLVAAALSENRPPEITFTFRVLVGEQSTHRTVTLPVPPGEEQAAAELVRDLQSRTQPGDGR